MKQIKSSIEIDIAYMFFTTPSPSNRKHSPTKPPYEDAKKNSRKIELPVKGAKQHVQSSMSIEGRFSLAISSGSSTPSLWEDYTACSLLRSLKMARIAAM